MGNLFFAHPSVGVIKNAHFAEKVWRGLVFAKISNRYPWQDLFCSLCQKEKGRLLIHLYLLESILIIFYKGQ